MAEVSLLLLPGLDVSVLAPTRATRIAPGDRLRVLGMTLPAVDRVRALLRTRDGSLLHARMLDATPTQMAWHSFATEFALPRLAAKTLLWLDISWSSRARSRPEHVRLPVTIEEPSGA
jgi:hypothetical protein